MKEPTPPASEALNLALSQISEALQAQGLAHAKALAATPEGYLKLLWMLEKLSNVSLDWRQAEQKSRAPKRGGLSQATLREIDRVFLGPPDEDLSSPSPPHPASMDDSLEADETDPAQDCPCPIPEIATRSLPSQTPVTPLINTWLQPGARPAPAPPTASAVLPDDSISTTEISPQNRSALNRTAEFLPGTPPDQDFPHRIPLASSGITIPSRPHPSSLKSPAHTLLSKAASAYPIGEHLAATAEDLEPQASARPPGCE